MVEIELRYEVLDMTQLKKFLSPLKQLSCKHDVDIYFDSPTLRLYRKGIFVRTRNGKTVDIKFNRACLKDRTLAIQDHCEEYIFTLPLREPDRMRLNFVLLSLGLPLLRYADFMHFLEVNRFKEHYRVDKVRTSYQHELFTISVDEVTNLGTFLEIELMADTTDNLEAVTQNMRTLLAGLSLKPVKTGYGTLLLRKKDFKTYLLGRFILEEDKIHAIESKKKTKRANQNTATNNE